MSDESQVTQQLEQISRAIRDLEGLRVDFRLARKLSEIQRMIAALAMELKHIWDNLTAQAPLPTDSSVLREAAQRTDQDYAIEHGGYLATAAEHLLDEINKYDMAQASGEDFDCDARSDAWNSLRSAIGEFRKRAKRALESSSVLREAATTQDDAATRLMAAKFIREHTFPAPGYDCNSTVDLMIAFAMALADSSAPKEK